MAGKQDVDKNAEQTLLTLDQLSQTLALMTNVVDRLKQQVTRQVSLNAELFNDRKQVEDAEREDQARGARTLREQSFVVEISQQELEDGIDPVVH